MQKGFAHLVLLLFILFASLSFLTYWFINKPGDFNSELNPVGSSVTSPKSSKKTRSTYENKILGFKFDYSNDLTAKEDSEEAFNKRGNGDFRKNFTGYVQYSPGKFLGAVVVLDSSANFGSSPFTLWVFDNPDNLSETAWYDKYWYFPFVWGDFSSDTKSKVAPKMDATISSQLAKSAVLTDQKNKYKFIYLNSKGKMFMFRLFADLPNSSIGDQILSSFKLTN